MDFAIKFQKDLGDELYIQWDSDNSNLNLKNFMTFPPILALRIAKAGSTLKPHLLPPLNASMRTRDRISSAGSCIGMGKAQTCPFKWSVLMSPTVLCLINHNHHRVWYTWCMNTDLEKREGDCLVVQHWHEKGRPGSISIICDLIFLQAFAMASQEWRVGAPGGVAVDAGRTPFEH